MSTAPHLVEDQDRKAENGGFHSHQGQGQAETISGEEIRAITATGAQAGGGWRGLWGMGALGSNLVKLTDLRA